LGIEISRETTIPSTWKDRPIRGSAYRTEWWAVEDSNL